MPIKFFSLIMLNQLKIIIIIKRRTFEQIIEKKECFRITPRRSNSEKLVPR